MRTSSDPVLEEIHAVRETLAKESGYNTEKIAAAARKRLTVKAKKAS